MRLKNTTDWKPLSDIPNDVGLLVTVLTINFERVKTKVRRNNNTGFHSLIGIRCANCIAWQLRSKTL
jgi:hypothetical protein